MLLSHGEHVYYDVIAISVMKLLTISISCEGTDTIANTNTRAGAKKEEETNGRQ